MPNNDDYGFWDADPDWSDKRLARAATSRGSRPSSRPNYGTRRIGALCVAGLVAVTVALVIRGSGSDDRISTAEAAAAEADAVDPALIDPSAAPVPPASAAPALAAATQPTPTQPTPTQPATTEPTPTEPATTEPATTEASSSTAAKATANVETAAQSRPVGVGTPVVETKRTCAISYTVRSGDYWISIAKASSVKLADLLSANGATVSTPLYPGRSICLPANATTPTTVKPTTTTAKPTTTTVKPTATTTKPKPTANTAPASTAAPSTTAPPPPNSYTKAQVEQIIRNVWPDDLEDEAVRIATRESNLIPTVRNSCCYGLFQIYYGANKASLNSWGITSAAQLYDPQVNAYAAYAMYLRANGWGPWAM